MNKLLVLLLFSFFLTEVSCQEKKSSENAKSAQTTQVNQTISVDAFEKKLQSEKNAQLIDVRTPEEFADGYLQGATNIDWRSADFATRVGKLDKNRPVFVYCLGGGRSAAAAEKLQELGFNTVYNMDGGYLKWTAGKKPVVAPSGSDEWKGMTVKEYEAMTVAKTQFVLVDFNAAWCAPCRQMMPMLEKITAERKGKVTFLKVDADANKSLLQAKGIEAIPYFEVYENGKLKWKLHGYMDEQTFLRESGL